MSRQRKKRGRNISGILLLDKPAGISSNGALQQVKRLFNANKAGHSGNLDVPATGLLPICLGEATKVAAYLLNSNKTYRTRCKLGITTTTADASGEIVSTKDVPKLSKLDLKQLCQQFVGEIEQVPPMYSALKHNGKRLYEFAYQGIEVERKSRNITIYDIELIDFTHAEFEIEVSCSKGTYIRTLVEDMGNVLGCGAHVLTLRRLKAGPFKGSQMITAENLWRVAERGTKQLDKLLLPIDAALSNLPEVTLSEGVAYYFCQGQAVTVSGLSKSGQLKIYNHLGQFIGLGELAENGQLAPKRLINNQEKLKSKCFPC